MKRRYALLLFFVSLLFISCEYKDLCYEHPHTMNVKVEFDWQKTSIELPRWMEVWLLPTEGSKALHFQISDYENGYIHVPPGQYKALCYNGDTDNILEQNEEDYDSFLLTTNGTQPERIISASLSIVEIKYTDAEQVISFIPENTVMDVTVIIRNVKNLKSTKGLTGILSGMSSGCYVGTGRCADECLELYSEMEKVDSTTLKTQFVCFGHCPIVTQEHVFSVVASVEDGSYNAYHWTVSERMHSKRQDPIHIEIVLDGLELPENIGCESGITTDVDGWQNIWIEI